MAPDVQFSLRLRLTVIFAAGLAVVLTALGTFVYLRMSSDLLAVVDFGLRSRAQLLVDGIKPAPNGVLDMTGGGVDGDESFAQIFNSGAVMTATSRGIPGGPLLSTEQLRQISGPTFLTLDVPGFEEPVRLLAEPIGSAGGGVIVVGTNLGDTDDSLSSLLTTLLVAGSVALVIASAGAWLLAGAALRPVERMRRETSAITVSEPERRLQIPETGDELARLATTLNSMLDRLQEAMSRERRFVDDASHEMRTPLATLRAEIDLALTAERTAPELTASMRSAQEDVIRLQRLTDDLLVLARSHGGRMPVRRVPTRLPVLLAEGARSVRADADAANVGVDVQAPDVMVHVDPDRIHQAVRNLLENAIRHSPQGGSVRLSATCEDEILRCVVSDAGPGFPPELLETAFNPFTRGPDAAGRPDGSGLGLAIVRSVAAGHAGRVWAENTAHGARVTMEFPYSVEVR